MRSFFSTIDWWARRCVAWPMALLGLMLCLLADRLIRSAAWVGDVDIESDEEYL